MVPTMIGLTMQHPEFRPSGLGSFTDLVYGASPMPQALLEKVLALYPDMRIWQGYGMTESSSVIGLLGPDEHRKGGTLRPAARAALEVETLESLERELAELEALLAIPDRST